MGLNERYFVVRSNILMIVPSGMIALNFVSQEKSHKSLNSKVGFDKSLPIFYVNKFLKKFKVKNLNLKCIHCNGQEHLV